VGKLRLAVLAGAMTSILRAGVIGAGVFGGHHAAKWAGLPGAALAAVHDPHPERARALAERHGARAFDDPSAFFAAVDLVSIASPASSHAAWALAALSAGKSVYVEKPLATDLAETDAIAGAAAAAGAVVACGFLERAAFEAMGLFGVPQAPLRLEAVRVGTPSPRNLDVSVVLDLMIHDLDLALAVGAGEPLAVEAEGAFGAAGSLDEAQAEVVFDDGFTASFLASRAGEAPRRAMRLVYPSGELSIDFLTGAFENTTPFALDANFAATPAGSDRLAASLGRFLAAVRGEASAPMAGLEDGAKALDLALAVQHAAGGG
jgi:predicted dehydrogenase